MKVVLLVLLTLSVIAGVPASFAAPQYLASFNTVYGNGSCLTCHVNPNGGGPVNDYGTLFKNQPNYAANASAALIAIGAPPNANPTVTTSTPTPVVTTVTATDTPVPPAATTTPSAPGFGIVLSFIGLLSWSILAKKNNK